MTNGFGDVNNDKLESLFVFNGTLYGGLNNLVIGLEVWGSTDGTTWNRVNPDGFGDSNNESTLWSNETVAFNNSLYMGVANGSGVEIWKRLPIFGDVSSSYWAGSFVERLYSAGITGGCGVNPLQYCPEGTVTRAQMAVFLERGIHGSLYTPPAVGSSTGFGDVAQVTLPLPGSNNSLLRASQVVVEVVSTVPKLLLLVRRCLSSCCVPNTARHMLPLFWEAAPVSQM